MNTTRNVLKTDFKITYRPKRSSNTRIYGCMDQHHLLENNKPMCPTELIRSSLETDYSIHILCIRLVILTK